MNGWRQTFSLDEPQVKVGGHQAAHSNAISVLVRAIPNPQVVALIGAIKDDYFATPTNRAPVNLPSALMSGA